MDIPCAAILSSTSTTVRQVIPEARPEVNGRSFFWFSRLQAQLVQTAPRAPLEPGRPFAPGKSGCHLFDLDNGLGTAQTVSHDPTALGVCRKDGSAGAFFFSSVAYLGGLFLGVVPWKRAMVTAMTRRDH